MKTNAFGDPILQPTDDIGEAFSDHYGTDGALWARFLDEDPTLLWCCTIADADGNELEAQGFADRDELVGWLKSQRIEIEE